MRQKIPPRVREGTENRLRRREGHRLTETSQEPGRMKTYRFGVNLGPSRSRAEWVEKARKLEDLGDSTLTVLGRLIRN